MRYDLKLQLVDVKGAYLNVKLDDTVYMHQPEGFIKKGEENLVCKLNKSIYGLKQSGQVWHGTMRQEMEKISFTPGKADPMVYLQFRRNRGIDVTGWYMDDRLLAANSVKSMEKMLTNIKGSFNIEDLGEPTQLLCIKISRNCELGSIHISQPSFIDTITKKFEITPGHSIHVPMDLNIELQALSQE